MKCEYVAIDLLIFEDVKIFLTLVSFLPKFIRKCLYFLKLFYLTFFNDFIYKKIYKTKKIDRQ